MALRLAGDAPDGRAHGEAAGFVQGERAGRAHAGCSPGSGSPCSACGPGTTCPDLPPELIYLPKWFPFNVYDWACWARQTIVPLTIVGDAAAGAGRCRSE